MARYDTDGTSALAPDYDGENPSSLGTSDPYNRMLASAKADRTPDLGQKSNIIDARDRFGKNPLSSAESTAAKNGSPLGTNASIAEKLPQSASPIKFTGKGAQNSNKSPVKLGGIMKKGGPIAALAGVLLLTGGGMFLGQSSLPFSLLARVSQEFNGRAAIASIRSNEILSFSMNPKNTNIVLQNTIFGNGKNIGKRQLGRLNANGIEQIELEITTTNGKNKTARPLSFVDDSGNTVLAFADPSKIDIDTAREIRRVYGDIDILDINDALASNTAFRHKYTASTLTWRGKIANSFNSGVALTLKRLGLGDRNRFKNWSWGNDRLDNLDAWANETLGIYANRSESRRRKANEFIAQSGGDVGTDSGPVTLTVIDKNQGETDADGNPIGPTTETITPTDPNIVDSDGNPSSVLPDTPPTSAETPANPETAAPTANKKAKKTKLANTATGKVISMAATVAGVGVQLKCNMGSFGSQLTAVLGAQRANNRNSTSGAIGEAWQRPMGFSEDNEDAASLAHLYVEAFTRPGKNGKAPIDGEAAAMVYGSNINQHSETFSKTNNESLASSLPLRPQSGQEYTDCAGLSIGTAFVTTAISIALNFIPGFAGAEDSVKVVNGASKVIKAVSTTGAIASLVLPVVVPIASQLIMKKVMNGFVERYASSDLASELLIPSNNDPDEPDDAREAAGNEAIHGLRGFEGKSDQTMSLAIGSRETHAAMIEAKDNYLANLAEYERATMSPFDITSENTFLGSLFYKTMPLRTSSSSFGLVSNLLRTVGSSFATFLPSAYAQTETNLAGLGECEILDSIGAIGDKFCEPIYEQDFSTIDMAPDEIFLKAATGTDGRDNFDKDDTGNYIVNESGNPEVRIDSELMKYITNCTIRDSQPGIADGGVAAAGDWIDQLSEKPIDSTSKTAARAVVDVGFAAAGFIPGVGTVTGIVKDVADLVETTANGAIAIKNAGYVSAQYCVASSSNPKWNEKFKYYAQYLNDQEQFEGIGMIEESSRTVALNKYYDLNPLDTSYEGILARYSGLTKEQVVVALDYMDYMDFVASYNPSDRLPVEKLILPTINDLIPEAEIASHTTKIGNPLATFVYSPVFLPLRDRTTTSA